MTASYSQQKGSASRTAPSANPMPTPTDMASAKPMRTATGPMTNHLSTARV